MSFRGAAVFAAVGRLAVVLLLASHLTAAEQDKPFQFADGQAGPARLEHQGNVPILRVEGTPEQMGSQQAKLIGHPAEQLITYPKDMLGSFAEKRWPEMVTLGNQILSHATPDHRAEFEAFVKASGIDRELAVVGNTMVDTYRRRFGCSSLIINPEHTADGGPLFGRNLDFFSLGVLHRYNMVIVYRPKGKHAFACVGFPGLLGCLSGMNDAGLAVAVHEMFITRDGAPMLDPAGTPYTFCFRRILEECTSVEEAEKLLRSMKRTTLLGLAVCDRKGGAVLEMTPKTVAIRRGRNGVCICTNHFRTKDLARFPFCIRYGNLVMARGVEDFTVKMVAQELHDVNLGRMTLQTMVFEPAALRLHLAIGQTPASGGPLVELDLRPMLGPVAVAAGQ